MAVSWLSSISNKLAPTDNLANSEEPDNLSSGNANESYFLAIHVPYSCQERLWSGYVVTEQGGITDSVDHGLIERLEGGQRSAYLSQFVALECIAKEKQRR